MPEHKATITTAPPHHNSTIPQLNDSTAASEKGFAYAGTQRHNTIIPYNHKTISTIRPQPAKKDSPMPGTQGHNHHRTTAPQLNDSTAQRFHRNRRKRIRLCRNTAPQHHNTIQPQTISTIRPQPAKKDSPMPEHSATTP